MLPKVNHSELEMFIELAVKANENLLVVGKPGIGKTVGIKGYASKNDFNLVLSHPAVWEPTDAKGLPAKGKMTIQSKAVDVDDMDELLAELDSETTTTVVEKEIDCATFLPFDDLLRILTATKPTIWFIDDLGQAPPSVQAALMQYLEGGELEGKKIPDCVHIIAATNGREHKAGVKGLLEPVKSRFGMIVELTVNLESFRDFMLQSGMPIAIPDYLNFKPGSLVYDEFNVGMENSPCPRLWEKLGKFLNLMPSWNNPLTEKLCCSTVGEAVGREFYSFLSIYNRLLSYEEIVSDPMGAPIDHTVDVKYALMGMLATKGKAGHDQEIFTYIRKIKKAYQFVFVRSIHAMKSELVETPACNEWLADNADTFMQALNSVDNSFLR